MIKLWAAVVIGTLAFGTALFDSIPLHAATAVAARSSDAGGVKVVVTPKVLGPAAKVWEFEVVMDTHTKPLNENLAEVAVLVDDAGRRHTPTAWQGDPPAKAFSGSPRPQRCLSCSSCRSPASVEWATERFDGS